VWSPLAGGWLAGKYRAGEPAAETWRTRFNPGRFDTASPEGRRKSAIVDALQALAAEAGMPLVHLALRFVLEHRAVDCAIVGPRTLEQLQQQLGAADGRLDGALLDAIDALVPPGAVVHPADLGVPPPVLADPRLRRRPA
jgi:aryl-alcohol dehydrogenase-like predicted oxidoreductase